jgi:hypothetical protein
MDLSSDRLLMMIKIYEGPTNALVLLKLIVYYNSLCVKCYTY